MKNLILIFISLAFVGCTIAPTTLELEHADYGQAPTTQAIAQGVNAWLVPRLKDPTSARFEFGQLKKGWVALQQQVVFGYTIDLTVNARNSFGGYAGPKLYRAFFRNGEIRAILHRVQDFRAWSSNTRKWTIYLKAAQ